MIEIYRYNLFASLRVKAEKCTQYCTEQHYKVRLHHKARHVITLMCCTEGDKCWVGQ